MLFAAWLGYGVVQGLRFPAAAPRLRRMPPSARRARALGWMLAGCGGAVAALAGVAALFPEAGQRPVWATGLMALGGGWFVHSQMAAAAHVLTLVLPARNESAAEASESKEPQ